MDDESSSKLTKVAPLYEASSFGGFRKEGYPAQYEELKTAAHVDVLEAGLVLCFVLVGASLLLLLPAARGTQKINIALRICVSLIIGGIITITNFGYKWEVGSIVSKSAYKPLIHDEVTVSVGLHIGLRAINVTLRADKEGLPDSLKHEIIDYNEHFSWTWDQGRFGFGPYAGRINREFREAQRTGLPLPILWVVDYFTFDGEGYRFGRFYRTAGWYTHIAMWAALPTWMLSLILLHCAVHYGSMLLCLTGLLQLLACILWSSIRNPHTLSIPFEEAILTTKFGSDFWLTLINGIFCTVLGIVIRILVHAFPNATFVFFGIDPLTDYDEIVITDAEFNAAKNTRSKEPSTQHQMEMAPINVPVDQHPGGGGGALAIPDTYIVTQRRSSLRPKRSAPRVQRAAMKRELPPIPPRRHDDDEQPIYDNLNVDASESLYNNTGYQNRGYERNY